MKKKINFCLLLLTIFTIDVFAQNASLHLSKEQKVKDSIEFAKFKKNYPEYFLNKRLPIKLIDGNYVVQGYMTNLQINNNQVMDSIYHNFHPGMPDTTTVIPFNDIKVSGSQININLFGTLFLMGGDNYDSASVTSVEPDLMPKEKIGDFISDSTSVKISINGKILSDWKKLKYFTKQAFKNSQNFTLSGRKGGTFGYAYGYNICNYNLNINDQLLIEIKNDKNNWMMDRYNITRVTAAPNISSFIFRNSNKDLVTIGDKSSLEKKTLSLKQTIKR